MMNKYFLIIIFLFLCILSNGCNINNLNKNFTITNTSQIKQLIGITYDDIQKTYGLPEVATYYLNSHNLVKFNKKYITLRDFNNFSIIKAYYKMNFNNFIILWYKNNKVIDVYLDGLDNLKNNYLNKEIVKSDIKIEYFKISSSLNKNFSKQNLISNEINNIDNFIKSYNLACPNLKIYILSKKQTIYIYNTDNYQTSYILLFCDSKNNIIKYDFIEHTETYNKIVNHLLNVIYN